MSALVAELDRCSSILERDGDDERWEQELIQDIARSEARKDVLEKQISGYGEDAGQLAEALSGILPHIHTDNCPVCSRDFGEISKGPLEAHVLSQIARLTEAAGRLRALARERSTTATSLSVAERELSVVRGRRLQPSSRDELRTRQALLLESRQSLVALQTSAAEGQQLLLAATAASRELSNLSAMDQRGTAIRESAARFATSLGLEPARQRNRWKPHLSE